MNDTGWNALLAAIAALFGAFLTGLFAWLSQKGKARSDIEIAALAQWEKISAGWASRLQAVEQELVDVRKEHADEIRKLRKAHADEIDEMRAHHRAEMKTLRDYAEGLERQIKQDSNSTAQLLGDMKKGGGK